MTATAASGSSRISSLSTWGRNSLASPAEANPNDSTGAPLRGATGRTSPCSGPSTCCATSTISRVDR